MSTSDRQINVLFIWKVNDRLKQHLTNELSSLSVNLIFPVETDDSKLLKYAKNAHVFVGWRPSKLLLSSATNLELMINPGAGVQRQLRGAGHLCAENGPPQQRPAGHPDLGHERPQESTSHLRRTGDGRP